MDDSVIKGGTQSEWERFTEEMTWTQAEQVGQGNYVKEQENECTIMIMEICTMNARQWNLMIRMVNDGDPRTKAEKYFSKENMKIFDDMSAQLAELRKKKPDAAFLPVESD